jgi:hypothetical protein
MDSIHRFNFLMPSTIIAHYQIKSNRPVKWGDEPQQEGGRASKKPTAIETTNIVCSSSVKNFAALGGMSLG